MARFDELFDEMMEKAKIAADVAGKKTGEVVEFSKLKYQQKQISWDIEKVYAKLGAIVYEGKRSGENFDNLVDAAVEELDALNHRMDEVDEQLANLKKPATRTAPPPRPEEVDPVVTEVKKQEPEEELDSVPYIRPVDNFPGDSDETKE